MATGDASDVRTRLRSVLPPGWFSQAGASMGTASSPTPVLDTILTGMAETLSWIYSVLSCVKNQTRLQTSTDGWVDIAALDYFGPGKFLRNPGETDAAYIARIQAALLPKANTRENIEEAIEMMTGHPARMIEPWDPRDTGVWGGTRSFWGYDSAINPARWANGGDRYRGLILCSLPDPTGYGSPQYGWGSGFWGNTRAAGAISKVWTAGATASVSRQNVYDLINKLRPVGISIFVRFDTPAAVAGNNAYITLTDDAGNPLTDDSGDLLIAG